MQFHNHFFEQDLPDLCWADHNWLQESVTNFQTATIVLYLFIQMA